MHFGTFLPFNAWSRCTHTCDHWAYVGTRRRCAPKSRRSDGWLSHHSLPTHLARLCGDQCLSPVAQHFLQRESHHHSGGSQISPTRRPWHPSTCQGQHLHHLCTWTPSARITFKNSNITLGNTASPPYLPCSIALRTRSSIDIVIFSLKASTPPTLLERKITSLRPMASPPLKTLHNHPPIYPVPSLSCLWIHFLIMWLYKNWKTPDTKTKRKSLVSPMNPEANLPLPPPAPKPLMVAKQI